MKYLAQLKIPGADGTPQEVAAPSGLPSAVTGGLDTTGVSTIQLVFNFLFLGAATIAIMVIILSGIQWIRSEGDPGAVAAARSRLIYAIIGLVVVGLSFVIIQIVYTVLTGNSTPNPATP